MSAVYHEGVGDVAATPSAVLRQNGVRVGRDPVFDSSGGSLGEVALRSVSSPRYRDGSRARGAPVGRRLDLRELLCQGLKLCLASP